MLEYQLIRSKRRKTLSLQVKYGQVTVRAPYYVASSFIDTFINEKSAWLRAKIAEQQSKAAPFDFQQGSSFLYLGKPVLLNIGVAKQADVSASYNLAANVEAANDITNGIALEHLPKTNTEQINPHSSSQLNPQLNVQVANQLNVTISERVNTNIKDSVARVRQVKKQLECYFKQQAEKLILERLELSCQQTSLRPTKITIRQYSARWGSCNNRGEVSFNYLLMMTPLFVIDYVIVHELCHLVYLNHSKDFWQLVEQHSPEYQTAKEWLSDNQTKLHWKTPNSIQ